jgi:fumarate reductase subunit C
MKPSRPGPTRTAPPRPPDHFPAKGRYLSYVLFGACGFFLMVQGLLLLRAVRALGTGDPAAWTALLESFTHPAYLVYHVLAFFFLTWFILRLFKVFPATQPRRFGPLKRPPDGVIFAGLVGAFVVVSAIVTLVLWGALL